MIVGGFDYVGTGLLFGLFCTGRTVGGQTNGLGTGYVWVSGNMGVGRCGHPLSMPMLYLSLGATQADGLKVVGVFPNGSRPRFICHRGSVWLGREGVSFHS